MESPSRRGPPLILVLDASVALAWCFADEARRSTEEIAVLVAERGALVPASFHLEVANVLLIALSRNRISHESVVGQLALFETMALKVDDQTSDRAWHETLQLARRFRLSPYDAAYLELALRSKSVLATVDEPLAAAARRRGVTVLP